MSGTKAPEKSTEKPAQAEFAAEADVERAKQIAYLLQMRYGWENKTDPSSIEQLARASRQTEPPKWPEAKPVKLYKPKKQVR